MGKTRDDEKAYAPSSPAEVHETHLVDAKRDDEAATFLANIANRPNAEELLAPLEEREQRSLVRKIDWIMVPLLGVAMMMGSVDKVSLATAAVMGFREDTHLVGQEYSWTSSIIYFGAIAAIIPSLMLMQRLPPHIYISANVTIWGIITLCLPACKSFGTVMVVRILLGVFESVIFAGLGLIVSMWWTREEQPYRTAFIFSTVSSLTNGVLAVAAWNYKGSAVARWQLLFILVGAITLGWSFLLWGFLPANPTKARWLSLRQRVVATRRMQDNHTGMENKTFKFDQFLEAFTDPKTWFYFFINIALNVPNGALVGFNSIVVKSLGFTTQTTLLLGIPTGLVSWISSFFWGYIAVKTGQRHLSGVASCVLPLIGTILLYKLNRDSVALLYLYLCYMYWGPYIVMMGSMYANTGGYTKKLTVYALGYMGYCVGNIIGPQTFLAKQAPLYVGGVVAMLVCYSIALVLIGVYWLYLRRLNVGKAREYEALKNQLENEDQLLSDWQDLTDIKNPRFVYAL
ncbi:uncharacterized protein IL334_000245 [Kwoniella shivajii]|uniref:Allantoate permease n=1 Tax=Kwoniella shivajii TaxID=564305 RepID=A0ABZ1CNL7_9TREE|nr:hypothetical protein IL334_000245 [Kwoniella shivajii]